MRGCIPHVVFGRGVSWRESEFDGGERAGGGGRRKRAVGNMVRWHGSSGD